MKNLKYLAVGIIFGVVFVKAEIFSWFRIQEMFRFESFHMFGVIGTGVAVATLAVWAIRRFKLRTFAGDAIDIPDKEFSWGQVIGGLTFGVGWAITGACPGPIFAQIGSGLMGAGVILLSAVAGTWVYGWLRPKLPH